MPCNNIAWRIHAWWIAITLWPPSLPLLQPPFNRPKRPIPRLKASEWEPAEPRWDGTTRKCYVYHRHSRRRKERCQENIISHHGWKASYPACMSRTAVVGLGSVPDLTARPTVTQHYPAAASQRRREQLQVAETCPQQSDPRNTGLCRLGRISRETQRRTNIEGGDKCPRRFECTRENLEG